jgi:hypothetical protein
MKSSYASGSKEYEANLMYSIDERLSITSKETTDQLDPFLVREDLLDQGDHFMWEQGLVD